MAYPSTDLMPLGGLDGIRGTADYELNVMAILPEAHLPHGETARADVAVNLRYREIVGDTLRMWIPFRSARHATANTIQAYLDPAASWTPELLPRAPLRVPSAIAHARDSPRRRARSDLTVRFEGNIDIITLDDDDAVTGAAEKVPIREDDKRNKTEAELLIPKVDDKTVPTPYCYVCQLYKPQSEFPVDELRNQCDHELDTCTPCYKKWIDMRLWDHRFMSRYEVPCPRHDCKSTLTWATVAAYARLDLIQGYNEQLRFDQFSGHPDFFQCVQCGAGQLHRGRSAQPKVRCYDCEHVSCFTHHVSWHVGETCKQYEAYNKDCKRHQKNQKASLKYLEKKSQKCPCCQSPTVKSNGCDIMSCYCGAKYCWFCLKVGVRKNKKKPAIITHTAECPNDSQSKAPWWCVRLAAVVKRRFRRHLASNAEAEERPLATMASLVGEK